MPTSHKHLMKLDWGTRADRVNLAVWNMVPDEFATEPAYWIDGADEGLNYCRLCAEAEVEKINAEEPGSVGLDGGFDSQCDSPRYCECCGKRLAGELTDYGVSQELDHYANFVRLSLKSLEKRPGLAFSVADALGRVYWRSERQDLVSAKKVVRKLERLFVVPPRPNKAARS